MMNMVKRVYKDVQNNKVTYGLKTIVILKAKNIVMHSRGSRV